VSGVKGGDGGAGGHTQSLNKKKRERMREKEGEERQKNRGDPQIQHTVSSQKKRGRIGKGTRTDAHQIRRQPSKKKGQTRRGSRIGTVKEKVVRGGVNYHQDSEERRAGTGGEKTPRSPGNFATVQPPGSKRE